MADNPEKVGMRERLYGYFRNRPNHDSGATAEKAGTFGLRGSFGNYNFNQSPGPRPGANFSPYFSNPKTAPLKGMRRIFRDGKTQVIV